MFLSQIFPPMRWCVYTPCGSGAAVAWDRLCLSCLEPHKPHAGNQVASKCLISLTNTAPDVEQHHPPFLEMTSPMIPLLPCLGIWKLKLAEEQSGNRRNYIPCTVWNASEWIREKSTKITTKRPVLWEKKNLFFSIWGWTNTFLYTGMPREGSV